ncbi:MAG: hypothetical protein QG654_75, partial [Patescibacteria group bacterium]|nr:hypothetical protein [Patescibacteria group bacterium]
MKNSLEGPGSPKIPQNNVELIQNREILEQSWTVTEFEKVYPEQPAITGSVIAIESDEPGNPDKTAIVTMRTFIENGEKAKVSQKYVLGIKFYSFGDMATFDVISMDKGFHRDIIHEHLTRLGHIERTSSESTDKLNETYFQPMMIVGGHLNVKENEDVSITGESGDYTGKVLREDVNDIAKYVLSSCGANVEGDISKGQGFVKDMLDFMKENKMKEDFYERLLDFVYARDPHNYRAFTGQHLSSLIQMKVADRIIKEGGGDPIRLTTEEMTDGLGKYALVASVAAEMRKDL